MSEIVIKITFYISLILIIYHHAGYPLLLRYLAGKRTTPSNDITRGYQTIRSDRSRTTMTVLVPAYNEQQWIADKIRNLAALDYPKDKLKVIIACDGCTDNTVEIAQLTIQEAICSDIHFEIINYDQNRGKVSLINHIMPTVTSDITVMSDVSCLIGIDALLLADHHFQSSAIGVVNSHYLLISPNNSGEQKYWQYQAKNQLGEAQLGANIGAHGALFAFRTFLFDPLDQGTINDDFILPMQIIRKGYLAIYEPRMNALELEPTSLDNDVKRRMRISAGNMQQLIKLSDLLLPKYGATAFAFASGKGLRLLTPYLMIACLVCCLLLIDQTLFLALLVAQTCGYLVALLGLLMPSILTHKVFRLLTYLVVGHWVNLIGGLRYLFGFEKGQWKKIDNN